MKYLLSSVLTFFILGTLSFSLRAQDNTDSEENSPPASESSENNSNADVDVEENAEMPSVSAMPPRREQKAEIPDAPEDEVETLGEVEVQERIGPDPTRLLEDPLILKTEEDRKRELIQRHMDLAAQLLNSWTLPLLGTPMASLAEEEERMAELEAFKARQQRDLEALKNTDQEYYQERREEYYDTVIQAQGDRWDDPSESSF